MYPRSKSRRIALQLLYQQDVTGEPLRRIMAMESYAPYIPLTAEQEDEGEEFEQVEELDAFSRELVEGIEEHLEEIDAMLEKTSENWSLERMPRVDLGILRIATFEILYMPGIPHSVSINEAVIMSKVYGTDDSSKFINGVLGKISKAVSGKEVTEAEVTQEKKEEA